MNAAELIEAELARRGWSQARLSREIATIRGSEPQTPLVMIGLILHGRRRVTHHYAAVIARAFGDDDLAAAILHAQVPVDLAEAFADLDKQPNRQES